MCIHRAGVIPNEGSGIITWATNTGKLCLGELTANRRQDSYSSAHGTGLEAARSLALLPGETVLQVRSTHHLLRHKLHTGRKHIKEQDAHSRCRYDFATVSCRPSCSYSILNAWKINAVWVVIWPGWPRQVSMQVAWQSLLDKASEGNVSDDLGTGKPA